MSTERLVVKVPEPTGTSIAPWFYPQCGPECEVVNWWMFARYWTRSGRSEEQR